MKRDFITRTLPVILLFFFLLGAGCSTVKSFLNTGTSAVTSVYKKVRPAKPGLKKKVLVLPFLNQAGLGKAKVEQITITLIDLLKENQYLLVHKAVEPIPTSVKIRSPKFGIVIDPDLAKKAEEMGMNALITVVLNPFEVHSKKSGIWPFRKIKRKLEISMVVNVLDITNGTLFLTNIESRRIKIPERDFEEDLIIKEEEKREIEDDIASIGEEKFNKILTDILEDQASAITNTLDYQPWSGRVLSANQKNIIISAGKDVGLTAGSVFEVFGKGESISSASGRSLFLLGPKVGEIKTVRLMESYASAVPLTGGQFRAGQVIKMKN